MSKILTNNIGSLDRTLRIVLGLGLVALAFVGPKTPWGFVGFVPLVTAFLGTCPAYTVLGLSTCAQRTPEDSAG